jgi:hypothetical protein
VNALGGDNTCGCLPHIHAVPHWLHMAAYDLIQSRKLAAEGNWRAVPISEIARLASLGRMMAVNGVSVLPAELMQQAVREWEEAPQRWAAYRKACAQRDLPDAEAMSTELARSFDAASNVTERARISAAMDKTQARLAELVSAAGADPLPHARAEKE